MSSDSSIFVFRSTACVLSPYWHDCIPPQKQTEAGGLNSVPLCVSPLRAEWLLDCWERGSEIMTVGVDPFVTPPLSPQRSLCPFIIHSKLLAATVGQLVAGSQTWMVERVTVEMSTLHRLLLHLLFFLVCLRLVGFVDCFSHFFFFLSSRSKTSGRFFSQCLLPSGLPSPIGACLYNILHIFPLLRLLLELCFSLLVLFSPSSLSVTVAASLAPPAPVFS